MVCTKIIVFVVSIVITLGFPLPGTTKVSTNKVVDFMKKYGYLQSDDELSGALYTEEGISETVKTMQKFGAIPETGIIDNATLALILSPRCGVADIIRTRPKRYTKGSEGWNKRSISYFLANWSPKLGEDTVLKYIQLALDTWGKYGRLRFHRASSPDADIVVAFARGYHGDPFPFDGPGVILAHAFFPYESNSFGGDIHFDEDENWIDLEKNEEQDGMDFFTVALHELGHSLGLAHSPVANSVMFPYYRGYDSNNRYQLSYDDILGMYDLYIRRHIDDDEYIPPEEATTEQYSPISTTTQFITTTVTTETTTNSNITTTYEGDTESVDDHKKHDKYNTPTNSPSLPYICDGYFDAVANLRDEIFIFKDEYIWRLKQMGRIENGYPVPLRQMFPSLPSNVKRIDAAYQRLDGMIILFTGNKFWVYDGTNFIENSPRPLTDYGLPPNLDKVDAVQIWARNGKTYIYGRERFWRYNETVKQLDSGYPKHMERWRGVPENLDAAVTWKDTTYFFKAELFWKFDNDWIIITQESPFPAPQLWLGCPEDDHSMRRLKNYNY